MSSFQDERTSVQDGPVTRDGVQSQEAYPSSQQTAQHSGYGMHHPAGYGMQQWGMRPRRSYPIETKPFFLTSEFVGAVLAIIGIVITAAASDDFGAWRAWILVSGITAAYLISRGIAKSGTRSHSSDPREELDLSRGQGRDQQKHDGR